MSANKFKYFAVKITKIVKANNKAEAIAIALKARRSGRDQTAGKVVSSTTDADRISALEAQSSD